MKAEKIKTVAIIILAVLLMMSIFTQVLFCTLLGINNVAALKQAMLANDLLDSMTAQVLEDTDVVDNKPSETTPNSNTDTVEPTESVDTTTEPVESVNANIVLDAAGVKVTLLDIEYDTFWESYKLKFAVENNSELDVLITSTEETVDGFMVDNGIGFYCEVLAGKKAIEYMTLYNFELETIGITTPNAIEFKMSITDNADLFNTIADSDTITINIS